MVNSTFKKRLKLHLKHGQGQELAAHLGAARSTIYGWISDDAKSPKDYATVQKVADFLGVSAPYLVGWIDNPAPDCYKKAIK